VLEHLIIAENRTSKLTWNRAGFPSGPISVVLTVGHPCQETESLLPFLCRQSTLSVT